MTDSNLELIDRIDDIIAAFERACMREFVRILASKKNRDTFKRLEELRDTLRVCDAKGQSLNLDEETCRQRA